ncbi:hypothetical protein D3C84_964190 [compost metagenome]
MKSGPERIGARWRLLDRLLGQAHGKAFALGALPLTLPTIGGTAQLQPGSRLLTVLILALVQGEVLAIQHASQL